MRSSVKEIFQHLADTLTFQLGWGTLHVELSEAELMEQLEYGRDDEEAGGQQLPAPPSSQP